MKNLVVVIASLVSVTLHAQYYYNDLVRTEEISSKMKSYLSAKVQTVTATGYDPLGKKSTDFNEWQDVQANGSVLKITSRNGISVARLYYTFDTKTRLVNARDSSGEMEIITSYSYDAAGNLTSIKATTKDTKQEFNETDEHQWKYTAAGKPEKLWRIINGSDSIEYRFTTDEYGNIADETLFRRGRGNDPVYYYYEDQRVYYYYDDKNRLSDIVRYNRKAKELLPDVMFEYDESNRVIQRLTPVSSTGRDYLTWRYLFNDKGLKTKEALFDKLKELKGRIDYAYTYTQ